MSNNRRRFVLALAAFAVTAVSVVMIEGRRTSVREEDRELAEGTHGRSGAREALEFWTQSRAYPDKDIPQNKYFRAYEGQRVKQRELPSIQASGGIWDPIGPLNLQGRSLSVALNPLNPKTVYVGTASGGLWRSLTGVGGDWQQVKLGYPALGISAIAISPSDSNTMYIGTGEVYQYQTALGGLVIRTTRGSYGIGILKTTDGGSTWTKSLDWAYNQQSGIEALKMNPHNPNTLWAATTEGVYKTTDAGATWNYVYWATMEMDVAINANDTNQVLISAGNFGVSSVMLTTDGGATWNTSPAPSYSGKTMLEVYAAHPNVVYASAADSTTGVGGLFRSTDFGKSWEMLSDYTNHAVFGVQGWYSHIVAVHPTDSSQVFHAGVPLFKSTDGGRSFFSSGGGYADNHGYAHHPTNPNILYIVNDDGVYRSTDFGASFTDIGFGMQSGQIYNGLSNSTTDSMLCLLQTQDHIPGYIYRGSSVWASSAVDECGWTGINPANDNIMYAVARNGSYITKSIDRGISFSWIQSFGGVGAWNSPVVISPSNPDILYLGSTNVYKTGNAGGSWSSVSSLDGNPALSMAVAPTSSDTVYVATAPIVTRDHVYRTTNGGGNWSDVTGPLPNRYPIDMAVDPRDSKTAYIAFGGFGTGHLYKTTNTGTGWTDITGTLPDIPTNAIAVDPINTGTVYVGNDFGVYVSTNGGSTWADFSAGLPDAVIVADLAIAPSNRTIRVATHGNGVYERKLLNELPPGYFDYRATTLNSPADGQMLWLGSSLTSIKASFRNISQISRVDSFDVKYRILSGTSELFSSTKRIPGLATGEVRQVEFDGTFIPPDTAYYTLEAITLEVDSNPGNDTLKGTLLVVSAPTISNFIVSKIYSPYTAITGGSPGPAGDDVQMRLRLPFSFRFDGYQYDSIQISTNGWMEFGTGAPGSLRGLSTDGQIGAIGANENGRMGTTLHPTKVLGPWWEDMTTDYPGSTAAITSTVTGTTPNRVFTVQWKDMLAYYDYSMTTTRINFQIHLYESSNVIEYCYGPVIAGTFGGSDAGAMLGMKDYIGGDYRYYDIPRLGTGLATDVTTNLSPLVNWPGQDSCYHITTNLEGTSVTVAGGWNMVAVPVTRQDYAVHSVYPTAYPGLCYGFSGATYQLVDSLKPGHGYWLKFSGAGSTFIAGTATPTLIVPVDSGWNLIGSVDHQIPAPSGGIVASVVFGYSTNYIVVSTLQPGHGYWIKTRSSGSLILGPSSTEKQADGTFERSTSITVTDKLGRSQTLYLADRDADRVVDPSFYDMPPVPPPGSFDVRFASQRMLEAYRGSGSAEEEFPLQLTSAVYPLTVAYKVGAGSRAEITLLERTGGTVASSSVLRGEGGTLLVSGEGHTLALRVKGSGGLPSAFALRQNYPNPFNPSTAITFDVPAKSTVALEVYDILGRQVMTLASGEYSTGSYTVRADFSGQATGVYLYRLRAGNYTEVKKLVVTK
jgi:photosystem II stability/assembly factor-like uncharacterized protein